MKGIYRGPGDSIQLDGIEFKKGETIDVTSDQARRIRESDPEAVFDVTNDKSDDATALAAQDKLRTKTAKAVEKEA